MNSHSISFKITSREIAYAILDKQRLLFWEVHSSVSDHNAAGKHAVNAAFRFERFNITAAVLVRSRTSDTDARYSRVKAALRDRGVPIFEINEQEVLESFNFTSFEDQHELCRAAAPLFPQIQFARFMYPCLEAAAFSLYFETNRLLSINTPLE